MNRARLPILLAVSRKRKIIFSCPRSRPRTRSRQTGSAVPSGVNLLPNKWDGSTLRLNLVLTRGIPLAFRDGVYLSINDDHTYIPSTAIGSAPSLSGHAISYRWRSMPRVRRHRAGIVLEVVPVTGAAFLGITMD